MNIEEKRPCLHEMHNMFDRYEFSDVERCEILVSLLAIIGYARTDPEERDRFIDMVVDEIDEVFKNLDESYDKK